MALKSRLEKLETLHSRTKPIDPNISRRTLMGALEGTASKFTGMEFSKVWCDSASSFELAAATWLENKTATRRPALWQNVFELSKCSGPNGKLFAALLGQTDGY